MSDLLGLFTDSLSFTNWYIPLYNTIEMEMHLSNEMRGEVFLGLYGLAWRVRYVTKRRPFGDSCRMINLSQNVGVTASLPTFQAILTSLLQHYTSAVVTAFKLQRASLAI